MCTLIDFIEYLRQYLFTLEKGQHFNCDVLENFFYKIEMGEIPHPPLGSKINYGIAKMCFTLDGSEKVYKIPFEEVDHQLVGDSIAYAMEIYYAAGELKDILLPYRYEGKIGKYIVYSQPKAIPLYSIESIQDEDDEDEKEFDCMPNFFYDQCVKYYGKDFMEDVKEYLWDSVGYSDLHNENVGYYHNRPVLFDYEGSNFS